MTLHVDSEVGRLKQAILHRPDLELKRLTPTNHDEFLFDDVLWVKQAKLEHDAFAEALREQGVRVHLLHELLMQTLGVPEARKFVLEQSFDELVYGPMALSSLHEAFGQKNSLLSQLATTPGVEVRAFRPVTFLPSVAALKRRNHRKCLVVDGHTAVVTGRNLGAPYYRGFSEVRLSPLSSYREVPWLDCGAVFDGPLVSELERAFAHEWTRAGGDTQVIAPSPATGQLAARLVLHEGLRDTHTFDAQLALIRHAERELVIVNNFPLVVELQRALVAAIARGVRVRVLIGNVRPHFGDEQAFAGGTIRSVADQLVRSRLDAVVLAGGEVYEYALPALPDWDPDLGRVFPHVHAKLLLRDRKDVAVGSANLDVTAAYWESEALLIVHDPAFAVGVHEQLEALFASSRSLDPGSEKFKSDASQRAWLARYWPSLIG